MARSMQNDRLLYRDPLCPVDTRIDARDLLAIPTIGTYAVTDSTEYRPALVSFMIYRTPDFWWILLDYNQITFSQMVTGLVLRIPDETAVRDLLERSRRTRLLVDLSSRSVFTLGNPPARRVVTV